MNKELDLILADAQENIYCKQSGHFYTIKLFKVSGYNSKSI